MQHGMVWTMTSWNLNLLAYCDVLFKFSLNVASTESYFLFKNRDVQIPNFKADADSSKCADADSLIT